MKASPHFAICVDNSEYPASLELHKLYRVLPDQDAQADGDLRIIDESGEDYLFPAVYFVELPQTAADTAHFLQQFETGHGDYSKDRHEWLDGQDLDTIVKRIQERRKSDVD
jgi:hypothetical protein